MRRSTTNLFAAAVLATLQIAPLCAAQPLSSPANGDDAGMTAPPAISDNVVSISGPASSLKHLYMFGKTAQWRTPLVWRYNDAGRPAQLSKNEVVAGIAAAAAQWTSACGVGITQSVALPDTATLPQDAVGSRASVNENVIGWADLSAGGPTLAGITYLSGSTSAGLTTLTDADVTLSTANVRSAASLRRTVVHELGHAIGLAHSNVSGVVMSGPGSSTNPGVPGTVYANVSDLQPDDLQGCLCLYGPGSATAGKGYLCGLPPNLDFGSVATGATSAPQIATLTNRAPAGSLTVGNITLSDPDFQHVSGCGPGTVLAPGASCAAAIAFRPTKAGARQAAVQISAGPIGPYEFPVVGIATGSAAAGNGEVVEFYNANLDNFFVTSNAAEQAAIAAGGAGPGWVRTGSFRSGGTTKVCRFYGSIQPGPNSHFYTIDPAECQGLKNLQAATPPSQPRWNFESMEFASTPAVAGSCPAGTVPVYRAYNRGSTRGIDSNHRLTTSFAEYQVQLAKGWAGEGVVMCAPSLVTG